MPQRSGVEDAVNGAVDRATGRQRYVFDGELYRAERELQGLTREELAVRLGCSVSQIAHVELNNNPWQSLTKVARFAAALGKRVDDFVVSDDEPVPAQ
jgi:transcriptional regulator with XRE-family HTH domain